jgi:hypothetical protein
MRAHEMDTFAAGLRATDGRICDEMELSLTMLPERDGQVLCLWQCTGQPDCVSRRGDSVNVIVDERYSELRKQEDTVAGQVCIYKYARSRLERCAVICQ